jgi:hypothetical protein
MDQNTNANLMIERAALLERYRQLPDILTYTAENG